MRLSALRLPRLFRGRRFLDRRVVSKTQARTRRENALSLPASAKQSSSVRGPLACFVAEPVIGPATSDLPLPRPTSAPVRVARGRLINVLLLILERRRRIPERVPALGAPGSTKKPLEHRIAHEPRTEHLMFRPSIQRKIVGIAIGLIVLMVVISALSIVMSDTVHLLLDELSGKYIPAYGNLARANIRSLERSIALRQMVIAKMLVPPDEATYAERLRVFEETAPEVEQEAEAAHKLINSIIEDPRTPSDNVALARLDDRIETAIADYRNHLNAENAQLLTQLKAQFCRSQTHACPSGCIKGSVQCQGKRNPRRYARAGLRQRRDCHPQSIANDFGLCHCDDACRNTWIALCDHCERQHYPPGPAAAGKRREVEAGRFDGAIKVTTRDEIGQLSTAFNLETAVSDLLPTENRAFSMA